MNGNNKRKKMKEEKIERKKIIKNGIYLKTHSWFHDSNIDKSFFIASAQSGISRANRMNWLFFFILFSIFFLFLFFFASIWQRESLNFHRDLINKFRFTKQFFFLLIFVRPINICVRIFHSLFVYIVFFFLVLFLFRFLYVFLSLLVERQICFCKSQH